jgi:hypothetical protein
MSRNGIISEKSAREILDKTVMGAVTADKIVPFNSLSRAISDTGVLTLAGWVMEIC